MEGLKTEIYEKKDKLAVLEKQLEEQINSLSSKEQSYEALCKDMDELIASRGEEIVKFNCSGEVFMIKLKTLLSVRDTFFYKLFNKGFDKKNKIFLDNENTYFLDRTPRFFLMVLDFLRFKKIDVKRLNKEDKIDLRYEAQYFEVSDLCNQLGEFSAKLEIVEFEHGGDYAYKGKVAGTGRIEDLKDRSLQKGICSTSPGLLLFTLNDEYKITEIDVGGYCGNASLWNAANGEGATILTSVDKATWITVGSIPNGFGSEIKKVKLTTSNAKFIKFTSNNYLGIGYLDIKTEGK